MDERQSREELSLKEISRIADSFKGLHSLILSGGEPFLRDDLNGIVSEFHKRTPAKQVSIPTNLFCRDAPEKIKEMALKHPSIFFRILISIDGVGDDHDVIRGHKGGFKKLIANLEKTVAYKKDLKNLSLNSVTVLSSFNSEKIKPTIDFAGSLEIDDIKIIYVRGNTREPEAKDVSPDKYQQCIKYAEELTIKKDRTKSLYNDLFSSVSLVAKEEIAKSLSSGRLSRRCNAGSKLIVISETGEVFPCEILAEKLGDLREHDYNIASIMKSDQAKDVLDFIRAGKCSCTMDCNAISNAVYSPSLYLRALKKYISSKAFGHVSAI